MPKKQAERKDVPSVAKEKVMQHARIELPDDDYLRLKNGADRYHIRVYYYIKVYIIERIERDEARGGKA